MSRTIADVDIEGVEWEAGEKQEKEEGGCGGRWGVVGGLALWGDAALTQRGTGVCLLLLSC